MTLTKYMKVNAQKPEPEIIENAARLIKAGELVAFPTETVYGLGVDVFQPLAVEKIFLAKGRPQERPLLVHISDIKQLNGLVSVIPEDAKKLMERFWPGPLSIILPARDAVPLAVRGGGSGVGLRMPSHPVAIALINAAGPIAAPSANLYGRPSPTNAKHVREDLDNVIAAVVDAGETGSGIESTLIDMCSWPYQILRLGGVEQASIEKCLDEEVEVGDNFSSLGLGNKMTVQLCVDWTEVTNAMNKQHHLGKTVGLITAGGNSRYKLEWIKHSFKLDVSQQKINLYAILREAEALGVEVLLVAPLERDQVGAVVIDRLQRMAWHD